MDDIRLLIFRCGTEEYAISLGDVIGIIGNNVWRDAVRPDCIDDQCELQEQSAPILRMGGCLKTGDNKLTLLIETHGIQSTIVVDEIVRVTNSNELLPAFAFANLKIWQFKSSVDTLQNEQTSQVSFANASDSERRRILEATFFHDIINTAGALKGIIGLLKDDVSAMVKTEVEFVEEAFRSLVEEIKTQKYMVDAENKQLVLQVTDVDSCEELTAVCKLYKGHELAKGKQILLDNHCCNKVFCTDQRLLRRILGNMVKNALESSDQEEIVTLGCSFDKENKLITFWVHNNNYMDEGVQKLVFNRAFSTKGAGRGLGTYSMKLFGELFLKGTVNFFTDTEKGTTFYIKLPVEDK